MINFLRPKIETFGLDISDSSLKAAEIKNGSLISFTGVDIEPGTVVKGRVENKANLTSAIKSLMKTFKPRTKYVSVSLPEESSFLKVIRMPKMSERDLESAVIYEAENHLPVASDKVYLDYQVIGPSKDKDGIELLMVALPREVANNFTSAIRNAGLFPVLMEIESLAIVRSLINRSEKKSSFLIVDIGESKTSFIIFAGGVVQFSGSIQTSSGSLTEEIMEAERVDRLKAETIKIEEGIHGIKGSSIFVDDLKDAIKRHIEYYRSRVAHEEGVDDIKKVVLCGGGANLKGLLDEISKTIKSDVEIGDPFINLSHRPINISREEGLKYGVVIGSALSGFVK